MVKLYIQYLFEIRGNMIFLMFSRKFTKEEVEMLFYSSCFLYQEFFQNVFHMNHVLKK
jgi:hypothetical protein